MKMKVTACLALLAVFAGAANAADTRHGMGDLTLSGYVDGQFMAQQANKGGVPGGDTQWKSSFGDNSHLVLWAQGNANETASFISEMYYWQATNAVSVQQAAIDWHLYKTDAYKVTARMGKFYYPFGIEARSRYATTNKLVSRPYIQSWTDNGIAFSGGGKMGQGDMSLNWDLAATNGITGGATGILAGQNVASGNTKSFGGRLSLVPMTNYEVGGSFAWGKWDAAGNNNYMLFGAHGVAMPMDNVDVRAEWMMTDAKTAPANAGKDLKTQAVYGQVAYKMPLSTDTQWVTWAARFGWLDPNTDTSNDAISQLAVGGTYHPAKGLDLKAEFDWNIEQVASGQKQPANNALLAEAVVAW